MPQILVTGVAGYVGSVVAETLLDRGYDVIGVDNLSRGHRAAVDPRATLYRVSMGEAAALDKVLERVPIDAAIHIGGLATAAESMADPSLYYAVNLTESAALFDCLRRNGVTRVVFSSSAAVYGAPSAMPIAEDTPAAPISPYGQTKAWAEAMLSAYAAAYGFQAVSLRYFNVAGASGRLGEAHYPESHLIPAAIDVAMQLTPELTIYGDDFPTHDGTAIRDYVHVADIAEAHVRCLEALGELPQAAYNVGAGEGHSVHQVVDMVERVTLEPVRSTVAARRPGDPPALVADPAALRRDLGWAPEVSSLDRIVKDAFRWRRDHPAGYAAADVAR